MATKRGGLPVAKSGIITKYGEHGYILTRNECCDVAASVINGKGWTMTNPAQRKSPAARTPTAKGKGRPAGAKDAQPRRRKTMAFDEPAVEVARSISRDIGPYAREIVDDPEVRATLLRQAREGCLPVPLMVLMFHYAYGKPAETMQHTGGVDMVVVHKYGASPERAHDGSH